MISRSVIPPYFDFHLYSVWAVTPRSRATSFIARPASTCFTAAIHRSDDLRLGVLALISSERLLCPVVWSFPTYDWLRLPGAGQKDFGTPDHPALGDMGIEESGETLSPCNRSAQTVLRPMDTCVKDGSAHLESK